jgi:hypothetical protein
MKTKKIIFIRHGEYVNAKPFNLSDEGKITIRGLAMKLIGDIRDKDAVFITSIANRTIQTSEVLQEIWSEEGVNVSFDRYYELWSGSDAFEEAGRLKKNEGKVVSVYNKFWLRKFIASCNKEVVVVVTHFEIVKMLPKLLGFPNKEVAKGQARILNLQANNDVVV